MADSVSNPKVVLKKKQIPVLVDFCLEESIEFSVKQQTFPETEWEIELKLKDIKTAIIVGMFLRENKFEVEGLDQQRYKKTGGKKADEKQDTISKNEPTHKAETKTDQLSKPKHETEDNQSPTLM
jgi:hypothetical protein